MTGNANLRGYLELLGGWDRGTPLDLGQPPVRWRPGSTSATVLVPTWIVDRDGFWNVPAPSERRPPHGGER